MDRERFFAGRLVLTACVAIVAWVYLPALDNGLVWDDPIYLRGYPQYWMPELWLQSFSEPLFISVNYYRPLVNATFLLDVHLFGGSDFVYHLRAPDVLRHRLVLSFEAEADGVTPDSIIERILDGVGVP